jgi:hypothetical protein
MSAPHPGPPNSPSCETSGLDVVVEWLRGLAGGRFYGSVQLKFQSGGIVQITCEQSYKPHELPREPRRDEVRPGGRITNDQSNSKCS